MWQSNPWISLASAELRLIDIQLWFRVKSRARFSTQGQPMKQILLLLLLSSAYLHAQEIVVRAGHLINPAEASLAANQTIIIEAGKITAIGTNLQVPEGADVIDLQNEWVMPGLVDAHTHITM